MTFDAPESKIVRWGVLGCSRHALSRAVPAIQSSPNARILALASRDSRKAREVAAALHIPKWFDSYDALLGDPRIDAVYVPLPNHLHSFWSLRALGAGKHVLCEKPAALSGEEIVRVDAACAAASVLFMEGLAYRFHPQFEEVRRLMSEGAIGDLRLIRASFSYVLEPRHSPIKTSKSAGGGALADIGCYCIDLSCWLFGCRASNACVIRQQPIGREVDFLDVAIMDFDGGRMGLFDVAFSLPRRNHCELVGTDGTVEITEPFLSNVATSVIVTTQAAPMRMMEFAPIDPIRAQFEHFSQCILDGGSPVITLGQSLANAATFELLSSSQCDRGST